MTHVKQPRPTKVFCQDCRYYYAITSDWGGGDWCDAPGNFMNTYIEPSSKRIECPRVLNKLNRCTLFTKKGPSPWKRMKTFISTILVK